MPEVKTNVKDTVLKLSKNKKRALEIQVLF